MSNQLTTNKQKKFSVEIQSETYKNLINRTLGDKDRAARFIASISSAVATNSSLQECDAGTILSGALLGESLNLSPSPQLGQYYLVPFNKTLKKVDGTSYQIKVAQFQLGYKGYIQLAIRSGQYKKLNVLAIKEGELIKYDPLNEDIEVRLIENEEDRENAKTVGYYAMFEYTNGFKKSLYWSKKKMLSHADKYSQAFSLNATKGKYPRVSYEDFEAGNYEKKDEWLYSSFWYKDFDGMAYKTMLRQLISKWGIMSIDLQQAMEQDMATINTDGTYEYVDNEQEILQPIQEPENDPFAILDEPNGGEPLPDALK